MALSGISGTPLRYRFHVPPQRPVADIKQTYLHPHSVATRNLLYGSRTIRPASEQRCKEQRMPLIKCAMDASFGDLTNDSTDVFPRINIKDPYKRLGISREASEGEIQGARNFLIQRYAGHQPSVDAIEAAHNKIIMQQFYDRKNPKIDYTKKIRDVSQSRIVLAVTSRFKTPSKNVILKTAIAFIALAALTVLFPTEEGPTLQVAVSFILTIYFIYDRLKSKLRSFLYGAGTFALSWLVGTFLMVSVIPPILKGQRSLEVTTSILTYIFLWVSSTCLI